MKYRCWNPDWCDEEGGRVDDFGDNASAHANAARSYAISRWGECDYPESVQIHVRALDGDDKREYLVWVSVATEPVFMVGIPRVAGS